MMQKSTTIFSGKVVWIIGSSSGIGKELALQLLSQGAQLILSSRNEVAMKEISQEFDGESMIMSIDLAKITGEEIDSNIKRIFSRYKKIDYLFLNSGVSHDFSSIEGNYSVVQRKIFEVNYFGLVKIASMVSNYFIRQGFGHVVVTSSVMAKFGFPNRSIYCSTKHALHGFFDSLRFELMAKSPQLYISMLVLGAVDTNIGFNAYSADGSKLNKKGDFQKDGMSVKKCVNEILSAVVKRKKEVVIGKKGKFSLFLNKYFPNLFRKLVFKYSLNKM